jgi:signal transduction histidine kinase
MQSRETGARSAASREPSDGAQAGRARAGLMPQGLMAVLRRDSVRLWATVGGPILALVLVMGFLAFQILGSIAHQQDHSYADQTRSLVRKAVDAKQSMNANVALDYGNWTDAWLATRGELNQPWLDANYQTIITSGLAVYRPGTGARHAHATDTDSGVAEALTVLMASWAGLNGQAPAAASQAISGPYDSFVLLDGTLASISVRPIQPEPDSQYRLGPEGPTDWSVAVQLIGPELLSETATALGLGQLRFVAAQTRGTDLSAFITLPVFDAGGVRLGDLVWPLRKPGTEAFAERTLPIALTLLIIGILTILVARGAIAGQLEALRAARVAAEDGSRAKSAFLAGISHELRTPLNAIIGYAEILQEDSEIDGNATAAQDAGKITRSAKHLLALINDLLDHSKIEAGKMDLFVEQAAFVPVLEDAAETVRPLVEASGSRLVLAFDPGLGEGNIDSMRLKQCLLNLLSNAAKFTRDGEVRLYARPVTRDEQEFVRLEVADTGIGMSKEALGRLFTPFVQADAATASKFGGTGLGLTITRALVEAMGGSVSVTSEPGKGSSFVLLVPRAAGQTAVAAAASALQRAA